MMSMVLVAYANHAKILSSALEVRGL